MSFLNDSLDLNRKSLSKRNRRYSNEKKNQYFSDVEISILKSKSPIKINNEEEIVVNGQKGIWANKDEAIKWRGPIPLSEYSINKDSDPEIVVKTIQQMIEYEQELAIRYLRPPTPPAPGEILINVEKNHVIPPAPPLIIRQQPPRPETPEPLVIREKPPTPLKPIGRKIITISGRRLPPPPRKVVVERLSKLPNKPQSVFVERWLPYPNVKRRIIYQKPTQPDPVVLKPKNVIIQWEAPKPVIKQKISHLGVVRANPIEYVQRYGPSLIQPKDLPKFVLDIKAPDGMILAADQREQNVPELEGDLDALNLIDLEKEGLSQYKSFASNTNYMKNGLKDPNFDESDFKIERVQLLY